LKLYYVFIILFIYFKQDENQSIKEQIFSANKEEKEKENVTPPIVGIYQKILSSVLSKELVIQEKLAMDSVLTEAMGKNTDPDNNESGIESIRKLQSKLEEAYKEVKSQHEQLKQNLKNQNDEIEALKTDKVKLFEIRDAYKEKYEDSNKQTLMESVLEVKNAHNTVCNDLDRRECISSNGCVWCNNKHVCESGDQFGPFNNLCQLFTVGVDCTSIPDCGSCTINSSCM